MSEDPEFCPGCRQPTRRYHSHCTDGAVRFVQCSSCGRAWHARDGQANYRLPYYPTRNFARERLAQLEPEEETR